MAFIYFRKMDIDILEKALETHYNIKDCSLTLLAGYVSENYKVQYGNQTKLLKVYSYSKELWADVMGENRILKLSKDDQGSFPQPIADQDGNELRITDGKKIFLRLLTYLEGKFLAEIDHPVELIWSFGAFLGKMDKVLSTISESAIKARRLSWDIDNLLESADNLDLISESKDRKIVAYFLNQWETNIIRKVACLRSSYIHNDANEWNVIANNGKVTSIIDFGDMVYSRLIYELAGAAPYLVLGKNKPIEIIAHLVASYDAIFPLREEEIDIFYYLIACRMCASVLHSARAKIDQPDNKYITISEEGMWNLLRKWISISPLYAQNEWREAVGLHAIPPKSPI